MSTQLEINNIIANSGNFTSSLQVNGTGVSISGHTHTSSQISDFNSSVSGLVSGVYAPLSGKLNQFASTTSAELFSVISDDTGSGLLVFNTNPTFSGSITVPTGNISQTLIVGNNTLTSTDTLNIINSANLYLWSNFR